MRALLMAVAQQQRRGAAEVVLPEVNSAYGGGIVLYHFQVGDYGYEENKIIITKVTSIGSKVWGCSGTLIPGLNDNIGYAAVNTASIVSNCADDTAAKLADNYNDGTYSDWLLPTSNECLIIENNPTMFTGHPTSRVWTSNQVTSTNGWAFLRNGTFPINSRAKTQSWGVVPVRYMIVT